MWPKKIGLCFATAKEKGSQILVYEPYSLVKSPNVEEFTWKVIPIRQTVEPF